MENNILYLLLVTSWAFVLFLFFFHRRKISALKKVLNESIKVEKELKTRLANETHENLDKDEKLQNLLQEKESIEDRFYKMLPALIEERKQKIDELLTHYSLQCNLLDPLFVAQKNEIFSQIIQIEKLMEDMGFNLSFEQIMKQLIELKKTTYKLECEQLFKSIMTFLNRLDKYDEQEKIEPDGIEIKKIELFYQNYIDEIEACDFRGKPELIQLKKKLLVLLLCFKEFKILHLYYIIWGKNIEKKADAETHKKQIENYKPEVLEKTKHVREKYNVIYQAKILAK